MHQQEGVGTLTVEVEEETPLAKVARVLVRTLESAQEPEEKKEREANVVNISDSTVKALPKARGRKELGVIRQTLIEESLPLGNILLKDEDIEQLFPKAGVPPAGGLMKTPLVVCGPAPPSKPMSPPLAKRGGTSFLSLPLMSAKDDKKKKEEKENKGEGEKEKKKERKEGVSQVAPKTALGIEGQEAAWGRDYMK
ncbi:hypothetical protein AXF42_Ash011527 [Apostasia shenzhenica]|uniref:Uncharacterized protein n=1 Tax=Apostasia shenzhenica TaxID=1088818 RepID=A0A2I0BAV3_9ASPA|nr:hypothetical protein AXF42_Ash011527 [Apostasia shenzhenica]